MLYLPDRSYLSRFEALAWPLPPGLLPWLFSRGLAIYVLPKDESKAIKLVCNIKKVNPPKKYVIEGDTRLAHQTAHYLFKENCIVIPHETFYREYGESVLLHEVGHAIDFNYLDGHNNFLSSHPVIWRALRVRNQLNEYCSEKLKTTGLQLEQFACSFVAFFQEPDNHLRVGVSTIDELSPDLIEFFKTNIMDYFQ